MAARDPETSPAVFFGRELQRARIAAGFKSQDALAVRLGFDRTVITKAESGTRPPSDDVIARGDLAPGAKLPAERDLAELIGHSPETVAKARRMLVERGLVESAVGRGSFVVG